MKVEVGQIWINWSNTFHNCCMVYSVTDGVAYMVDPILNHCRMESMIIFEGEPVDLKKWQLVERRGSKK